MANWISKMLNGSGSDPAALKAALTEAGRDQAERRANIKKLQERLHQGYQDALDNKKLRAIESELDDEERELKKLDAALPDLRSELSTAQAAAVKRAEDEAVSKFLDLAERSAKALEACDVAFVEQRLFWDRNEHMLRRVEPLGCALILGEGHGVQWAVLTRKRIAEVRAARARRDNPQPAPPPASIPASTQGIGVRSRLPHEKPPATDSQREVSLALIPTGPTSRGAPQANDVGPLLDGHVRVIALRAGYTDYQGTQHRAGHIFQLPREYAEGPARAGAIEICEGSAAPATAVSGGAWKSLKDVSSLTAALAPNTQGEAK
jgi:hypothetical protein